MQENVYRILMNQRKLLEKYKRENERLKELVEYYKNESYTDSLTHLNNRRSIDGKEGFDVIILGDIDHFKKINDKYGHDCGDDVLVEISNILRKYTRDSDLVCRWGGEEFVILLKDCKVEEAYSKAIFLKDNIENMDANFDFKVTMSFGVSDMRNKTMQEAIKEADEAMYKSKERGRNRVTIYKLKRNN